MTRPNTDGGRGLAAAGARLVVASVSFAVLEELPPSLELEEDELLRGRSVSHVAAECRVALRGMLTHRASGRAPRDFLRESVWVMAHAIRWCEGRADPWEAWDGDAWRAALARARELRECSVCGRRRSRRARGPVCRDGVGCVARVMARARTAGGV